MFLLNVVRQKIAQGDKQWNCFRQQLADLTLKNLVSKAENKRENKKRERVSGKDKIAIMVILEDPGQYNKVLKVKQKKTSQSSQKTLRVANQVSHPPVGNATFKHTQFSLIKDLQVTNQ